MNVFTEAGYRRGAVFLRSEKSTPLYVDAEYQVEDVLDVRVHKRKNGQVKSRDFLVKWLDYGPEHNSWEPESLFNDVLRDEILRDPRWASSKA